MILLKIYRKEIGLVVLFGIANALPFHFPHLGWLAFGSLIPLFICIEITKSRLEAFAFGYLGGLVFFGLLFYWVNHVAILGWLALTVFLAAYLAVFAALTYSNFSILWATGKGFVEHGWIKVITVSAMWVILEFIRSHVPVLMFPWALEGYSQWRNVKFIQSADLVGAYGISFLVVLANACLYACLGLIRRLLRFDIVWVDAIRQILILAAVFGCFAGPNYLYGQHRLKERVLINVPKGPEIAVVQGNIPQNEKWDEKIKSVIYRKYDGLTRQAALEEPDLIIWPETAFPGYWEDEAVMSAQLQFLSREIKKRMLIGSPTLEVSPEGLDRKNSAIYLNEYGVEMGRYHKLRLVPFGEYVPFLGLIRRFYDIAHFTPGKSVVLFELPYGQEKKQKTYFSVLICFEDIFSDLCRFAVKNGSRILVNITNDAWFEKTTAPYQHAQASVFRAVEYRVSVVRAANTGLSCFIDPYGFILGSIQENGEELFITGYKQMTVTPGTRETLYLKWGDAFIAFCFVLYLLTYYPYRHHTATGLNLKMYS